MTSTSMSHTLGVGIYRRQNAPSPLPFPRVLALGRARPRGKATGWTLSRVNGNL
jgi:hypothetical protein